jgi:hypothetical protein
LGRAESSLRHPKAPRAEDVPLWIARTGQPLTGNEIFHTIGRRASAVTGG